MGGVTTLFVGILAISNPADAISLSLIGNYSSTNDLSASSITGLSQRSVGFTLPTGSDYTLDSITLRLSGYTDAGDVALLQIYQDVNKNSTNPNGAVLQSSLEFLNPNSSSDTVNNFTFTPTSTFTFLADTRYWLLVDRTTATVGSYSWRVSNPSITPTGISGITSNGYQSSGNNGTDYSNSSFFNSFDIQVTEAATAVPFDFDPSFGVAFLGGGWLLRKHLKKKKSTKD
jgi:hypothetical protein